MIPAIRPGPLLLFACVTAVYLAALPSGFVYDDHEVILEQPAPRTAAELARVFAEPHGLPISGLPYYRPITRATLLAQKALHGERPALFHAGNAVLMGAIALAAAALLRAPAFAATPVAALAAAAVFALHPVASACAYPVASGRESAVPALFALIAAAAFVRPGLRWWGVAWLAFAAALWSKEQALVLPAVFVLLDGLGLSADAPGRSPRRWLARHLPMLLLLLAHLAVRRAIFGPIVAQPGDGPGWNLLGPPLALLYALQVLLTPFVALVYEPARAVWWSPARLAIAVPLFVALVGLAARRRPARAAFWCAWLLLCILPTANLLPQEAPYAERFVFLGGLGVVALAADALGSGRAGVATLLVLAALCAGITLHRSVYYRDSLAFFRQWVSTSPSHANAHRNLGTALAAAGRGEEALAELRRAVRLAPALREAHFNLGVVLAREGRVAEAAAAFEQVLRLAPDDAEAHFYLGVLREAQGRPVAAIDHYDAALRLRPDDAEARARRSALRRPAGEGRKPVPFEPGEVEE